VLEEESYLQPIKYWIWNVSVDKEARASPKSIIRSPFKQIQKIQRKSAKKMVEFRKMIKMKADFTSTPQRLNFSAVVRQYKYSPRVPKKSILAIASSAFIPVIVSEI
jgi:hypothetical protein